ncbi:RING/FYVE/PHD zinc finger superfamily protein [Trifolium repens]|nr:RING/FYVE/PHD zinc finger superfamily protein [Trifolium repens]
MFTASIQELSFSGHGLISDSTYKMFTACCNYSRQIAVEDASRKRSMDLRLLHGVAYGHSWFGRWGYKFYRGSFGVTEENYYEAMEILGSLVLDDIVRDLSKTKYHKDIKQMIRFYRDMSETRIVTIRELLRFMLNILLE